MSEIPEDETYSTAGPICPFCRHEHTHDGGYFYDENLTEFECDHCSQAVSVLVYTSTSWTCSLTKEGGVTDPRKAIESGTTP